MRRLTLSRVRISCPLMSLLEEIKRLRQKWQQATQHPAHATNVLAAHLTPDQIGQMDLFDQLVLANVIQICRESSSMAEAGRKLFNVSRTQKSSSNDTHRLKTMLGKFGLGFSALQNR